MTWQRLESSRVAVDPTEALKAKVADPLWFLGRQWQVGELTGHDGGRAVEITAGSRHLPLQTVSAGTPSKPIGTPLSISDEPLEAVVEAETTHPTGLDLSRRARLGASLLRRLRNGGAAQAFISEVRSYSFDVTLAELSDVESVDQFLITKGVDALAVADALDSGTLRPKGRAVAACAAWQQSVQSQIATAATDSLDTWDPERLEHRFHVTAETSGAQVHLAVDEFHGGRADWFVGRVEAARTFESDIKKVKSTRHRMLANPVRFAGMPALRWWEIEPDGVAVAYGQHSDTDLARGIVSAFATTLGSDWLLLPIPANRGEFVDIHDVEILDSFGDTTPIPSMASSDHQINSSRPWRFMEMTGDPGPASGRAPLVFLAPTAAGLADGQVVEHVRFARDEVSNLAWGVESSHMSPSGRPVDRGNLQQPVNLVEAGATTSDTDTPEDQADMHWQLDPAVSEHWIPFIAVSRTNADGRWLQRARMAPPDKAPEDWGRPRGTLLRPDERMLIREEEVPRSGMDATRRFRMARTAAGQPVLWMARRKRLGKVDANGVWLPDQVSFPEPPEQ